MRRARRDILLALSSLAAALLLAAGALAPWGALSAVPEQAATVASTRWALVALAALGGALPLALRHTATRLLAFVAFALAAVLVYGELRYEGNQAVYYDVAAPRWGLPLALGAALAGAGLWGGALLRRVTSAAGRGARAGGR